PGGAGLVTAGVQLGQADNSCMDNARSRPWRSVALAVVIALILPVWGDAAERATAKATPTPSQSRAVAVVNPALLSLRRPVAVTTRGLTMTGLAASAKTDGLAMTGLAVRVSTEPLVMTGEGADFPRGVERGRKLTPK